MRQSRPPKPLSVEQRVAIRAIADGLGNTVHPRTASSLYKRGLMTRCPEVALTAAGRRVHERIMSTGDGPEQLKAMLSFGSFR
jgi:hypothetical protein